MATLTELTIIINDIKRLSDSLRSDLDARSETRYIIEHKSSGFFDEVTNEYTNEQYFVKNKVTGEIVYQSIWPEEAEGMRQYYEEHVGN